MQRALDDLAGPRVGWKLAASNAGGQKTLGVDAPLVAGLYASSVYSSGAAVAKTSMGVAEAEIAFRIGRDLPAAGAPFDRDEILGAIVEMMPAIELPDSRFDDPGSVGAAQLLADAACAGRIVLGEPATSWRPEELPARQVAVRCNGVVAAEGSGAAVMGDPCEAAVWMADELARYGVGLRAGDVLMTGSLAVPNPVGPGDEVVADFGDLGAVAVRIQAEG